MTSNDRRIIVAGAGPAGQVAALALAQAGFPVALVGPQAAHDDRRTTALMTPALATLDRLGVLRQVLPKAAPLRVMRIVDASSRLVRSPTVTFRAREIDEDHFGLNIANSVLNAALSEAIAATPGIQRVSAPVAAWRLEADRALAILADADTIEGLLVVGADGRRSPSREAAGITVRVRDLPQTALVLTFAHTRDHGHVSTEFHTETGPFTQVPLPGRRSSLVWVLAPAGASDLMAAEDGVVARLVEERMQSMLGAVTVEPGRQLYPLSSAMPSRFARNRVALVGEAAHVVPPIGAQGLNLGFRDIEDLILTLEDAAGDDPGSDDVMSAYDARRRPDILSRATAVGLLNRSLLSDLLPAQLARSAGLNLLNSVQPLRAFFMREGMRPGSGFSAMLSGKQVGG